MQQRPPGHPRGGDSPDANGPREAVSSSLSLSRPQPFRHRGHLPARASQAGLPRPLRMARFAPLVFGLWFLTYVPILVASAIPLSDKSASTEHLKQTQPGEPASPVAAGLEENLREEGSSWKQWVAAPRVEPPGRVTPGTPGKSSVPWVGKPSHAVDENRMSPLKDWVVHLPMNSQRVFRR